jgi:lipopolysaccharide transport system permease protein
MIQSSELPVRVYSPEPLLGNHVALIKSIFMGFWDGRELAWRLFVRDRSAQFRQTYLGYVWVFLPPLVASISFIFLNSQGFLNIPEIGISYPAFAMMGTLLWQIFTDSMGTPQSSLNSAKSMLAKINFPREALLLAGIYNLIFNFFIRLILMFGIFIYWEIPLGQSILFFPIAVFSLFITGFSIGLILAPIGTLYGDIGSALSIVTRFWMLLTPVVYPASKYGLVGFLTTWNPISPLVTTARECLTAQPLTHLPAFWIVTACAAVAAFLGLVLYRLAMPHLIVRMGG